MRYPDTHQCAARHCQRQIPRKFLMCRPHWDLVPRGIQAAVYATWNDGEPTREYVSAVTNAIAAVAKASPPPLLPPPPTLFDDGGEDGLVYPGDTPPDPIPAAPAPPPKQTLSPELAALCTQAATRLETLGLSNKEAKRRLWDTIKDAVPSEPLGEADISRITPEVIAAAEIDVRRHRESNTRAAATLNLKPAGLLKAHAKCHHHLCRADIHFAETASGKKTPLNLDGSPHWKNCPGSKEFKRK